MTGDRRKGVGAPTIEPLLPESDRTTPTATLVQEALDTALESLDTLEHQARDVARRFRRGAWAEAQLGLSHLMQSMQTLLKLAATAADASGIDLDEFCRERDLRAEDQTQVAVGELIRHQLTQDWPALAAALDRSFAAALQAWRVVFIALGGIPTGPYGHAA